jgi:hypothetical protein
MNQVTMKRPKVTSHSVEKPQYLRHLASCKVGQPPHCHQSIGCNFSCLGEEKKEKKTYRKKQVHHIHNHQDKHADSGVVVAVARGNQRRRDEMVAEHLPVVLSTVLNVDDHNLLQPKRPLGKHVPLH